MAGGVAALAGVSAFGFGGTNAHAVLEAAPEEEAREMVPPYLLPLSAHLSAALAERARSLLGVLDENVPDLAFTAARRSHHRHRLAVVAHDSGELRAGLEAFLRGEPHPNLVAGEEKDARGPVFVLAGQGPQRPGMGLDLAAQEPVFRAALEECDRLVASLAGWSILAELEAPEERSRLLETEVAQPVMLALQVALAALWRHWGVEPGAVVGHSAGEVAAAHLAGVLTLEEAARLAVERGRLLQRATAGGRMAQVELSPAEAREELASLEGRLAVAAVNAPSSVVVSGDPAALEEMLARLLERQIFGRLLAPPYAFHSPRIEPFLDGFEAALGGLAPRTAAIPLVSTLTGAVARGEEWDAAYWRRQARQPVLFANAVAALIGQGHRRFLEIGPHPVLSAALRAAGGTAFPSLRRGEPGRDTLLRSLAALWVQGQPVDWRRFHERGGRPVALPAYPWQRERCWLDTKREPRAAAGGHPLLGPPLSLAHPRRQWVWERDLGARDLPFLEDHRIEGAMVVPATAYLEMAVAASAQASGELPAGLADVRFLSPMVVPETGARRVQVVLAREEDGEAGFQIFSRTDGPWTLHADGRVLPANGNRLPEAVDLAAVRSRCPDLVPGADLYPRFSARGLQYGPAFQGIERLWRGKDEALGEVSAPAGLDLAAYHVHPAVLDACGQAMAAAGEGSGPFVPAGLDELRLHGRPGARLWSHASQRANGSGTLVGDGRLLDEEGRIVVEARGMRLRALDGNGLRSEPTPADWLYELRWEPVSLPDQSAAAPSGGWLIFADNQGVGEELAARLSNCAVVLPGASWEELPEGRFRIRPGEVEDVRRLLDRLVSGGWPPLRGAVHLWSLDAAGDVTVAALEEAERQGCGAALPLVQELLLRAGATPPRLWLVTRGAQPVGPPVGDTAVAVAQSPLWGFGRSLAQEHPALWGGLIDLDPEEAPAECAGRLVCQLAQAPRRRWLGGTVSLMARGWRAAATCCRMGRLRSGGSTARISSPVASAGWAWKQPAG